MTYQRNRREGLAHRARLREMLLPQLQVGARLPKAACLAIELGIDESQALRHLKRMLEEAGVVTRARWVDGTRGLFVTRMEGGA